MMDEECANICRTINRIEGIRTIESCCGHGKEHFRVWMKVSNLDNLSILLYYIDNCHVGFDWDCFVSTDCGMSPVTFSIESRVVGDQAYREAKVIALEIDRYLDKKIEKDGDG